MEEDSLEFTLGSKVFSRPLEGLEEFEKSFNKSEPSQQQSNVINNSQVITSKLSSTYYSNEMSSFSMAAASSKAHQSDVVYPSRSVKSVEVVDKLKINNKISKLASDSASGLSDTGASNLSVYSFESSKVKSGVSMKLKTKNIKTSCLQKASQMVSERPKSSASSHRSSASKIQSRQSGVMGQSANLSQSISSLSSANKSSMSGSFESATSSAVKSSSVGSKVASKKSSQKSRGGSHFSSTGGSSSTGQSQIKSRANSKKSPDHCRGRHTLQALSSRAVPSGYNTSVENPSTMKINQPKFSSAESLKTSSKFMVGEYITVRSNNFHTKS